MENGSKREDVLTIPVNKDPNHNLLTKRKVYIQVSTISSYLLEGNWSQQYPRILRGNT